MKLVHLLAACAGLAVVAGCQRTPVDPPAPAQPAGPVDYYGTLEPFAGDAVYFVVTDRFVNGDPGNDHRDQGGKHRSFDIPLRGADGKPLLDANGEGDNIGYLGGDFKGIVDNVQYIREMGFGALWITPIVDNPAQAFTGGEQPTWDSFLTDRGKSGYHGYWGTNFHVLDEHLPSPGLDFRGFTAALRGHGLKVVLDIVCNHGSPAYTMPVAQPDYGKIFAADGSLLADHQNLEPEKLDPVNDPLHHMFSKQRDLAQLADFDPESPEVLEYLVSAYLHWIEQGADAFRVDTVRHMPLSFWNKFNGRIRERRPAFFMFAEAFDYEAAKIAPFTLPQNGGMSVLDFPLKQRMSAVFGREQNGFEKLGDALFLDGGPYHNAYELMTFYDNHDMARLDASDAGFIDAHNWLFTARGIPVIYYGSEIGFMRGRAEHQGNRNYFGQQRIDAAVSHPIRAALQRIARIRARLPVLQRGLQVDLELSGDRAAFLRVLQKNDMQQTALVLLNKGDTPAPFAIADLIDPGTWTLAPSATALEVASGTGLRSTVEPHGVQVWLREGPVLGAALSARLAALMQATHRRSDAQSAASATSN